MVLHVLERAASLGYPTWLATSLSERDTLLADIVMDSKLEPTHRSLSKVGRLVPVCEVRVKEAFENVITHLKVEHLFLSPHGNTDPKVACLGDRIWCREKHTEIH